MQTTSNEIQGRTSQEMQAQKLLPAFPEQSNFQIHAHSDSKPLIKLQEADISQIVKSQLNEMLNNEFTSIILSFLQISAEQLSGNGSTHHRPSSHVKTLYYTSKIQVLCG